MRGQPTPTSRTNRTTWTVIGVVILAAIVVGAAWYYTLGPGKPSTAGSTYSIRYVTIALTGNATSNFSVVSGTLCQSSCGSATAGGSITTTATIEVDAGTGPCPNVDLGSGGQVARVLAPVTSDFTVKDVITSVLGGETLPFFLPIEGNGACWYTAPLTITVSVPAVSLASPTSQPLNLTVYIIHPSPY